MGARHCPYTRGTFRAIQWASGPIWVACDACRRYIVLPMMTDIAERQNQPNEVFVQRLWSAW